jgi:hypothetical protein
MLENLFGSKSRVKLLLLFFRNPNNAFFVREITRLLEMQINAIRRELNNLEAMGIIKINKNLGDANSGLEKKYYQINEEHVLFQELNTLLVKSQLLLRQELLDKLSKSGNIDYLLLTGIFIGEKTSMRTDMLIVGKISKDTLRPIIESFESDIGHSINFTLMTKEEFQYRKDITDRFLYEILEGKKIISIDKLTSTRL